MKHHLTRIICLGLAALVLAAPARAFGGGLLRPVAPVSQRDSIFEDVSVHDWYCSDIMEAVEQGMMNGVSETRFAPNEDFTRAMLVSTLYRLEGKPQVTFSDKFSDVQDGLYYSDAVVWAAENGLVNGSNGRFDPDSAISRQELATILWRYAILKGYDVTAHGQILPDFTDRRSIAPWAGEAMSWAYTRGILRGSNNALNPEGLTTRAEAASMLVRFSQLPTAGESKGYVKQ